MQMSPIPIISLLIALVILMLFVNKVDLTHVAHIETVFPVVFGFATSCFM